MKKEQYWRELQRKHKEKGDPFLSDVFWIGTLGTLLCVIVLMLMRTGEFIGRLIGLFPQLTYFYNLELPDVR